MTLQGPVVVEITGGGLRGTAGGPPGPTGPAGPTGPSGAPGTSASGNIDGGSATSVYGGVDPIEGGGS